MATTSPIIKSTLVPRRLDQHAGSIADWEMALKSRTSAWIRKGWVLRPFPADAQRATTIKVVVVRQGGGLIIGYEDMGSVRGKMATRGSHTLADRLYRVDTP